METISYIRAEIFRNLLLFLFLFLFLFDENTHQDLPIKQFVMLLINALYRNLLLIIYFFSVYRNFHDNMDTTNTTNKLTFVPFYIGGGDNGLKNSKIG